VSAASGRGNALDSLAVAVPVFGLLMGFSLVWAEQQEIGFPRTLGIGDNDVSHNGEFHVTPPSLLLRYGQPLMFAAVMGWG